MNYSKRGCLAPPGKTLPLPWKTLPPGGKTLALQGKTLPLRGKTLPLRGNRLAPLANGGSLKANFATGECEIVCSTQQHKDPPSGAHRAKTEFNSPTTIRILHI